MTSNKQSVWAYEPPAGREPVRQLVKLSDGYETVVYRFDPPAGAPEGKLPVIMVHGIQSHPGWYARSSLALADAGHTVYLPTRRGSGENTQDRGDAVNEHQLGTDVGTIITDVLGETGQDRIHFVGISWGGKQLASLMRDPVDADGKMDQPSWFASLSLLAPGIAPKITVPRIKRWALGWLNRRVWVYSVLFLLFWVVASHVDREWLHDHGIAFGWVWIAVVMLHVLGRRSVYRRRYPIPLNDATLFTNTATMQEYLNEDAATLHEVTGRFASMDMRIDLSKRALKLLSPTTLILASDDRIIDNEKTREIVQGMRADAHVVTLPGCHTLEFEEDITPLVDAMLASFERGES